jgi:hypothetical protein
VDGDRPEDSGRRVGRVIAVSASRATVLLDAEDLAPLEMGHVVKMRSRAGTVYAMVSRLEVSDPGLEPSDQDLKTAEIEFAGEIGEADGSPPGFQRGISAYPALDEPVWLATAADLLQVYARPEGRDCPDRLASPSRRRARLHSDRRTVRQAFQHCRHHRFG